jgi:hypothetical protein
VETTNKQKKGLVFHVVEDKYECGINKSPLLEVKYDMQNVTKARAVSSPSFRIVVRTGGESGGKPAIFISIKSFTASHARNIFHLELAGVATQEIKTGERVENPG